MENLTEKSLTPLPVKKTFEKDSFANNQNSCLIESPQESPPT